jgi:hypothetical protein
VGSGGSAEFVAGGRWVVFLEFLGGGGQGRGGREEGWVRSGWPLEAHAPPGARWSQEAAVWRWCMRRISGRELHSCMATAAVGKGGDCDCAAWWWEVRHCIRWAGRGGGGQTVRDLNAQAPRRAVGQCGKGNGVVESRRTSLAPGGGGGIRCSRMAPGMTPGTGEAAGAAREQNRSSRPARPPHSPVGEAFRLARACASLADPRIVRCAPAPPRARIWASPPRQTVACNFTAPFLGRDAHLVARFRHNKITIFRGFPGRNGRL